MKRWVVAGLGLVLLAGGAVAQGGGQQVVTERREGLKAMAAHMEAMGAIARAGGDPRPAVARINEMEAFFGGLTQRFPEGTAMGAPGIDSRALPAIWQNRADFEGKPAPLLARLAALKEVAAAGNASGFGPALQATGAACGDCHRPYRSR